MLIIFLLSKARNCQRLRHKLVAVDNPLVIFSHTTTELGPQFNNFNSGYSSEELVIIATSPGTLLPLMLCPTCFSPSSSSSCDIEIQNPNVPVSEEEEEALVKKLKINEVFEQEEGVVSLRSITRNREDARVSLCTPRLLLCVLDANVVECLVSLLKGNELESKVTRENCVAALYALSHGSLRFKGLAKEARAVDVLKEIDE